MENMGSEFVNTYIEKITEEVAVLSKQRLLASAQIAFSDKRVNELGQDKADLTEKLEQADAKRKAAEMEQNRLRKECNAYEMRIKDHEKELARLQSLVEKLEAGKPTPRSRKRKKPDDTF